MTNPWKAQHLSYADNALERAITEQEYRGQEPYPCPATSWRETSRGRRQIECDGTMFWKATVGAYKCPSCGALADSNGELY